MLAIAIVAATGAAAIGQDVGRVAPGWLPELAPALELYRAGEYLDARKLCGQIANDASDDALHTDAAALEALAIMRMPGRENRNNGRARLTRLAEEHPGLMDRPECRLAYGVASYELYDTPAALRHLNEAATGFIERKQPDRADEALVWLARAWARHADWEVAIPGLNVRRPDNRRDADRIRRERIEQARKRATALPGGAAYAARIDLVLAERLLANEADADEGAALLRKLSDGKTAVAAEARMALGRRAEQDGRLSEAAELYEQAASSAAVGLAREARRKLDAIVGARLELSAPPAVSPGRPTPIEFRCRNVDSVDVEIRRVDLVGWLTKRRGRLSEAALPTDGALVALHEFKTSVSAKHDWWTVATLDERPVFEAPPGASVIVARAKTADAREIIAKRLVISGDLRAHMFIGGRRAALWATPASDGAALGETRAWFWMFGSFVPKRVQLESGVADFALPAESRMFRDKRWVCVVQSGEGLALCQGTLTGQGREHAAAALVVAPPKPTVGETLKVAGFLIGDDAPRGPGGASSRRVDVVLTNTLDVTHASASAAVDEAGAFVCEIPVAPSMAGENLRATLRLDGRTVEQITKEVEITPRSPNAAPVRTHCVTPPWIADGAASLGVRIETTSAWFGARAGLKGRAWTQAVRLPDSTRPAAFSKPLPRPLTVAPGYDAEFDLPLDGFDLPEGPLAVGVWTEAQACDGRSTAGFAQSLIGPERTHMWVRPDGETPHVGELSRFEVGWFDPCGLAAETRPRVVLRRDGENVAKLDTTPIAGGLRQGFWRPSDVGQYEIEAALPTIAGEPFSARLPLTVADAEPSFVKDAAPLRYEARYELVDGRLRARIRISGQTVAPLLAIVANQEPLALHEIPPLDGQTEFSIPLSEADWNARLTLVAAGEAGPKIVGETEISSAERPAPALKLAVGDVAPGQNATLTVSGAALADAGSRAAVVVRLADLSAAKGGPWAPGSGLPTSHDSTGVVCVSSTMRSDGAAPDSARPLRLTGPRQISTRWADAWFDLPTLWIGRVSAAKPPLSLDVPMPAEPGRYRLVAAVLSPDGRLAKAHVDIDTRRAVATKLDAPESMVVGDRTIVGVLVSNRLPETAAVRLSLTVGSKAGVSGLRCVDDDARFARDDPTGGVLTLSPESSAMLIADIEAAAPGEVKMTLTATTASQTISESASCKIRREIATPTPPAPIALKRTLYALDEPEADDAKPGELPELARWRRGEIAPGDALAVGQLVLVREEFSLAEPLRGVSWTQLTPANSRARVGEWEGMQSVGARDASSPQSIAFHASWLSGGFAHIQEYVIVADRPGVCEFSPPTVSVGESRIDVSFDSGPNRLVVRRPK